MSDTEEAPPDNRRRSRTEAFAEARPYGQSQLLWIEGCLAGEPLFLATRSHTGLEQTYPLRREMPDIRASDSRIDWRPLHDE